MRILKNLKKINLQNAKIFPTVQIKSERIPIILNNIRTHPYNLKESQKNWFGHL